MKTSIITSLLFIYLIIFSSSCHLIWPFSKGVPPYQSVSCDIPIYKCDYLYNTNFNIEFDPHNVGYCITPVHHFNSGPDAMMYCDKNWVVEDIELDEIKGGTIIKTPYSEAENGQDLPLFGVVINEDYKNIYIAWDSRVLSPPNWLKKSFKKVKTGNQIPLIHTSIPNYSTNKKFGNKVTFEIWEYDSAPVKDEKVYFLGNNAQGASWPKDIDKAMYFVVIIPQAIIDDTNCYKENFEVFHHNCLPRDTAILSNARDLAFNYALDLDELKNPSFFILKSNIICKVTGEKENCETEMPLSSLYQFHSSAIFQPSLSTAEIIIKGQKYQLDIQGNLHFQYEFDQSTSIQKMKVNSFNFKFSPLNSPIGKFSNMSMNLVNSFEADCYAVNPPFGYPCKNYSIPANRFFASLYAEHADGYLSEQALNGNVNIQIDLPSNKFYFSGGPLTAELIINEEITPLDIYFNMIGTFENFAPRANAIESQLTCECSENKNDSVIKWDANASFDIDDNIPSKNFKWYEDYGLVTEHYWGSDSRLIIPANQMKWGNHSITLEVRDSKGIPDRDHFKFQVIDTRPPIIDPPQEVYAITHKHSPVKIYIASPGVSDICSDKVDLYNDIPPGNFFNVGITPVNWVADDNRGNITKVQQLVYVINIPEKENEIDFSLIQLYSTINNHLKSINDNTYSEKIEYKSILRYVDRLSKAINEIKIEDSRAKKRLIKGMKTVTSYLTQLQNYSNEIQEMKDVEKQNLLLIEINEKVENILKEIVHMRNL